MHRSSVIDFGLWGVVEMQRSFFFFFFLFWVVLWLTHGGRVDYGCDV